MLFAVRLPAQNNRGPQYMEQALAAIHKGNPRHLPVTLSLARQEQSVALVYYALELAVLVQSQLYAAYPDCTIERLPHQALDFPTGSEAWTTELRLVPDLFIIRRHGQFEDILNRTTADPLTALLSALNEQASLRGAPEGSEKGARGP